MLRQVVLCAIVSGVLCAPKPGYFHGGLAVPAATSYSSRIDIHEPALVKTYAEAPVITKAVVAAPIVNTVIPSVGYHEPLVAGYGYGIGHGLDYGYGHELGYGHGLGGHGYSYGGLGYGYGHHY
ncbi:cuticle protein 64-like [Cylas formicarius]|uniref:cuticle protein 64-like n=1 Tax=Cylas formicarius TaxID=197179 RepID=UPI002958AF76|nr:cuticle protein 64-like [Cylas formicarius]